MTSDHSLLVSTHGLQVSGSSVSSTLAGVKTSDHSAVTVGLDTPHPGHSCRVADDDVELHVLGCRLTY